MKCIFDYVCVYTNKVCVCVGTYSLLFYYLSFTWHCYGHKWQMRDIFPVRLYHNAAKRDFWLTKMAIEIYRTVHTSFHAKFQFHLYLSCSTRLPLHWWTHYTSSGNIFNIIQFININSTVIYTEAQWGHFELQAKWRLFELRC